MLRVANFTMNKYFSLILIPSVVCLSAICDLLMIKNLPVLAQRTDYLCVSVSSRRGWQTFNLSDSVTRVASIRGRWSVDTRNYAPVGAYGHQGRAAEALAPYNQYKHDQSFPFGALLMDSDNEAIWIQNPVVFSNNIKIVSLRINDADNALGDNGGSLQVCFD